MRRYRLIPYIYTAFHNAHTDGQPVMAPVFMADPADPEIRAEQQAFLLGTDILVIPAFAEKILPVLSLLLSVPTKTATPPAHSTGTRATAGVSATAIIKNCIFLPVGTVIIWKLL